MTGSGGSWGPRAKETGAQKETSKAETQEQRGLEGKVLASRALQGQGTGRAMQECLFLQFLLSSHPPAEESAPNHGCQSPSPASQDGEEEKEGAVFPERTVSTRNAKVRASKAVGRDL